jgi:predicted short-subunit dehydrogenase-like oxidoreductase (DUF2520 family)
MRRSEATRPVLAARIAVVGRGRMGQALAAALARSGVDVDGPLGRGATADTADVVLLCVPDAQIEAAAALIAPGRLVGHCSGATTLEPLEPHEAFSIHPLMTVPGEGARFDGAGCVIAGTTERALGMAAALARTLGMRAAVVPDEDRPLYHAAASMASNYVVALAGAAERLAEAAGVDRALLVPLVRAAIENWAADGPARALTGPIARGDGATVARQRSAVAARAPELLAVWDALAAEATTLARSGRGRK